MTSRVVMACTICVAVIGMSALSIWRGSSVETAGDYVSRLEAEGKRLYRSMSQMTRFSEGEDIIRARLGAASLSNEAQIDEARMAELLGAASAFLWMRFGQPSPVEYRAWREAQGREWMPREFLEKWWTISEQYRKFLGQEPKAMTGLAEMFDALWVAKTDRDGGFHMPAAFTEDERGVAIRVGPITVTKPSRGTVRGALTEDQWYGGRASSHCSWWAPPHTKEELLMEFGQTEYAEIGLIVACGDGSRRAMFLSYFWDPIADAWILHYLNTNNENSPALEAIDY